MRRGSVPLNGVRSRAVGATRRTLIFLLGAFCLTLLAVYPEPRARAASKTDWSRVPLAARRLLHMHVSTVPSYPEEGDWLEDVRRWPPTRVIDGKTYVLEFSAFKSDAGLSNLKSLADIPPGDDYGAAYVTYAADGKRSGGYGPSYYWRADSTLKERSYVTAKWERLWQYARSGDLCMYSFSERDSALSVRMSVDQWFGADGELIACRTGGKNYWRGVLLTDADTLFRNVYREWKRAGWLRPPEGYALQPCSPPSAIDTARWRTERLDPRFTFRLPAVFVSDSTVARQDDELYRVWTDGRCRVECQVGIWDTGPLRETSVHFAECIDTLDGVPFRLATTRSIDPPRYSVAAVSADSVLPYLGQFRTALRGSSPDSAGQHLLLAIIRTLKLEPVPNAERRKGPD